jgi:hypothetical protein
MIHEVIRKLKEAGVAYFKDSQNAVVSTEGAATTVICGKKKEVWDYWTRSQNHAS